MNDLEFLSKCKVFLSKDEVENRITELAHEIDNDYNGKEIVIISILKGALFFTIDLVKKIKTPIILDTIHAFSYVGSESTGELKITDDITTNIEGKDVLIVEDIIDTGLTLDKIRAHILSKNPASLKIAVLADKEERRKVEVPIDYTGFKIENKFIIGYGFDYDEKFRNLPYIAYVDE